MKHFFYLLFTVNFLFFFTKINGQSFNVTDQIELGNIARNEEDPKLRKIAIKKITDQIELGNIARNEEDPKLRKIAIKKITDQIELGNIASNEEDPKLRKIAIKKITDQIELGNIASNEEDPKLRKIAIDWVFRRDSASVFGQTVPLLRCCNYIKKNL
ncbi:hypothetical protein [Sphingobacterium cavernae]|uniref:hypothetical protein n=1 Tax=Sphingobacterium cavernae TaxID=2592657 RepID=UPI00122FF184|nr:hypothetical protein [Sphingobacterium cavernae]